MARTNVDVKNWYVSSYRKPVSVLLMSSVHMPCRPDPVEEYGSERVIVLLLIGRLISTIAHM